jgi:hypothetical protein
MLKRNLPIFLLAAALASGCAVQTVGGDDDGPNDPTRPDDDVPPPATPEGRFKVSSKFDLATNAPGTAGQVANYFINATDDPDDPVKFMVDELIKALPDGSIKNVVQQSAPFVTGYLNDRVLQIAPQFVTRILDLGDAFGQVTRNFGTVEELEINTAGKATKTVTGLHFEIDSVAMEFPFAEQNIAETRIENLQVALSQSGKLDISDHRVPLRYGQVLKIALDQAVIPMVDPASRNLEEVLLKVVNCQKVGQFVFEAVDFGSASTYQTACTAGLKAAARALYTQLDNIDGSALEFSMTGTARALDRSGDGRMDEITTGAWNGSLGYAGSPAPLGDATFYGRRM